MDNDDALPVAVEEALREGQDPEEIVDHIGDVGDKIAELTEDIRTGNLVYAQGHVLERAVELLRETYEEADEKGEREAEMMAVAIILDSEAEETVW